MRRRNFAAAARNLSLHAARRAVQLARALARRALGPIRRLIPGLSPTYAANFKHSWDRFDEVRAEPRPVRMAYARLVEAARPGGANPPDPASPRPRLALVTPFPPERTGIADYCGQLAPALQAHYDVTVVTFRGVEAGLADSPPVRGSSWFEQHAASFDRILYHFGNSHYHAYMVPLLERLPGVVALHDFGLGDFGAHLEHLRPGWWREALYESHGLSALQAFHAGEPWSRLVARFPSSKFIFDQAEGVIVHSRYAAGLARKYYGGEAARRTEIVPFIRAPVGEGLREQARARLGVADDEFLVCTFGFVGRTKLTRRIVEAWLKSPLATDERCRLVIVGHAGEDDYGRDLVRRLATRPEARIQITGYADASTWADHLAAADAAVQLRSDTRGENSGALFDCMAYGVPTIVNAHGSMAETPSHAAVSLPDRFTDEELGAALVRLKREPAVRLRLAEAGRREIALNHGPEVVAAAYRDRIERFHAATSGARNLRALLAAAKTDGPNTDAQQGRVPLARELSAADGPETGLPRLLVDVSAIAQADLHSGIQRVVRAQLLALMKAAPPGLLIEPVRVSWAERPSRYVHARAYAWKILGFPGPPMADEAVTFRPGDRLYVPDLCADAVFHAARDGIFDTLRKHAVPVSVLIHDILPLQIPRCFPPGADALHGRWLLTVAREADQLISISGAVRDELAAWLDQHAPERRDHLRLDVLRHGADIAASAPTRGLPQNAGAVLDRLRREVTFLMVGTIEPRKGYGQVLAAFHRLWEEGYEINLVIVGAEGWKHDPPEQRRAVAEVMQALRGSPQLAKRLFWLEGASDEYLEAVMTVSDCLIAASLGEGFGLPLIEAARHKAPIIARDIPVFREVAGEGAYYFQGEAPGDLAAAILGWLRLFEEGDHPRPDKIAYWSWSDNARRLLELLASVGPAANADRAHGAAQAPPIPARRQTAG